MANGAVTVRYGAPVVNVTATASAEPRKDIDFSRFHASLKKKDVCGRKDPGGFIKREGRPSEKAVLSARLMDRPLRPLFPKGYFNDAGHRNCFVRGPGLHTGRGCNDRFFYCSIYFGHPLKPIGAVSVGLVDGEFVINPTLDQRGRSAT